MSLGHTRNIRLSQWQRSLLCKVLSDMWLTSTEPCHSPLGSRNAFLSARIQRVPPVGALISVCWDQELWKTTNRNVEIQPQIWDEPSFSNDLRVLSLYHRHIVSLGRKLVAVNQNQEIDIFSNVVGLKGFKRQWRLFRRRYLLCCKPDDFSRLSYKVFVVSLPLLY